MQPFIGVTCNPNSSLEKNQWDYRYYLQAIEAAGGAPRLISSPEAFDYLRPQLDGLVLPGGCDIHPDFYGEEDHSLLEKCNRDLDELEFRLFSWALQEDMPVLGICRGMQLINIALGGNLYQDIGTQYPGSLEHRMRGKSRAHRVLVQKESLMEELLGGEPFWMNSRHHQALKDLGKGVQITGLAEDGIAELCEVRGYRLIIGAQAHPEEICSEVPACARLFSALINESSKTNISKAAYQLADID